MAKKCLSCGENNYDTNFCIFCGNPLGENVHYSQADPASYAGERGITSKNICPKCNSLIREDSSYCGNCGLKQDVLYDKEKLAQVKEFVTAQEKAGKKATIIMRGLIVILLIGFLWFGHRVASTLRIGNHVSDASTDMFNGVELLCRTDRSSQLYFDGAIKNLDKALQKDGNLAHLWFFRGAAYYYKYLNESYMPDKDPKVIEDYLSGMNDSLKRAIKLEKDYPEAHTYMGIYYFETGQYDKTLTEFDRAMDTRKEKWQNSDYKWVVFINQTREKIEKKDYTTLSGQPLIMKI